MLPVSVDINSSELCKKPIDLKLSCSHLVHQNLVLTLILLPFLESCTRKFTMILTSLRPYDLSVANARQPVVASTVLAVLATIMTLIRYANRLVQKSGFGWDDFLILGALVWFRLEIQKLGFELTS